MAKVRQFDIRQKKMEKTFSVCKQATPAMGTITHLLVQFILAFGIYHQTGSYRTMWKSGRMAKFMQGHFQEPVSELIV
jgi:hypothetical protein